MNRKVEITDFQNDMVLYSKGHYNHSNLTRKEVLFEIVDKHYGLGSIEYMTDYLILWYHMEAYYDLISRENIRRIMESVGDGKYEFNCYGDKSNYKLELSQRLKFYVSDLRVRNDKEIFLDLKVDEKLRSRINMIGECK